MIYFRIKKIKEKLTATLYASIFPVTASSKVCWREALAFIHLCIFQSDIYFSYLDFTFFSVRKIPVKEILLYFTRFKHAMLTIMMQWLSFQLVKISKVKHLE